MEGKGGGPSPANRAPSVRRKPLFEGKQTDGFSFTFRWRSQVMALSLLARRGHFWKGANPVPPGHRAIKTERPWWGRVGLQWWNDSAGGSFTLECDGEDG